MEDLDLSSDAIVSHVKCDDEKLSLIFKDGRSLCVPISWFPRLQAATQQQRDAVLICATGLHWEEINENISLNALMEGKGAPESAGMPDSFGEQNPFQHGKANNVVLRMRAWLRRYWPLLLNGSAVIAFAITTAIQVASFTSTLSAMQMQTRALIASSMLERWDNSVLFRELEMSIADGSFKYERPNGRSSLGTAPEQIMTYLNFLEDVGLFYHQGIIDTEILDALFGSVILEAYFNPEIKAYVEDTRDEQAQNDAFFYLQAAAEKLRERPLRKKLVALLSRSGVESWPPAKP